MVYTGGLRGRINGCDCSSGFEGGIDRRVTLLNRSLGDANYLALDCGGILDLDPEGGLARSRCMISGLARQKLQAIGVGARDLFYGIKFLSAAASESDVELLSLNIMNARNPTLPLFRQWQVFEWGEHSVAVTAISASIQSRGGESGSWIVIPPDSLHPVIEATQPPGEHITILLTDLDEPSLRRFLNNSPLFDFVFTSSSQVYSATPFLVGKCLVEHPSNSGRSFDALIAPLYSPPASSRFIHQPVTPSTPPDPETTRWVKSCLENRIVR